MNYEDFLQSKLTIIPSSGFSIEREELGDYLFEFQKDLVKWALMRGRAALFASTGMGKTRISLEWARHVCQSAKGDVLILAPLAVAKQTQREADEIGIRTHVSEGEHDVQPGINITNYDKMHKFDLSRFVGIVLDESSIIKHASSKMRDHIIQSFHDTPYKLACTATPAPNDYMELGNHAEFLGVMSRLEMLSMYFVHDGGDTSKWRLKGHAQSGFWQWVSSWAAMIRKPSDLGYSDDLYRLPELIMQDILVDTDKAPEGHLFPVTAITLQERQRARRATIQERCEKVAEIALASEKPFLIWCDLNDESSYIAKLLPGAVEVKGSDPSEHKERAMIDFADGNIPYLVTKASIAGWGLNWQVCSNMAFVGMNDSFEALYQAVRRCYRFGQTKPVHVYMISTALEGAIVSNVKRKESDFERMQDQMSQYTREFVQANVRNAGKTQTEYQPSQTMSIPDWLQ